MERDRDNIINLKSGSSSAFEKIYRKYWSSVYNFSRLYIKSRSESEEIVQEVFLRLWDSRLLIDEEKPLKDYLFVITRNYVFNQERKHFNREFFEMSVLDAFDSGEDVESEVEAMDLKSYINHLIAEMPEQRKHVFLMSRKSHLSYKEISLKLGITEKTVERHINEALKYLRKNLPLLANVPGLIC